MALPEFSMRQLLEAGVHFGHQTARWNPKMDQYIYGSRNGIHIMDLTQTVPMLDQALQVIRDTVAKGGRVSVRRHQASGSQADHGSRREIRAVLHEPPLVGWHADQLADRFAVHQPSESRSTKHPQTALPA